MFITFEGIEGSGKSTQIQRISGWLQQRGYITVRTREPGGSNLGKTLRSILLASSDSAPDPAAELYLFIADRAEHLAKTILPALRDGKIVLCDRYADSTVAYQAYGRQLDLKYVSDLAWMAGRALVPHATLLLDLPVELGLHRALTRNRISGTGEMEARFDREKLEFHQRVHAGYLEMARSNAGRFRIIDARADEDSVFRACISAIAHIMQPQIDFASPEGLLS